MKCDNPYINSKGQAFGCGQCLPCGVRRARIWKHRIMLEAMQWSSNTFLTLSYSDSQLPHDGSSHLSTLVPRHVQLFLKSLRRRMVISPRFFAVGEYGEKTWRPHYHLALFNFSGCGRALGTLRDYRSGRPLASECCPQCRLVQSCWKHGDVFLGNLEANRCGYVAQYTVKKIERKGDVRLEERHPEFARMSLRPAIGSGVIGQIANTLVMHQLDKEDDVPVVLRHGKKMMPLGRYMRRKLRLYLGKEENCPEEIVEALQAEVRAVWQGLEDAVPPEALRTTRSLKKILLKNALIDQNLGVSNEIRGQQSIKPKGSF